MSDNRSKPSTVVKTKLSRSSKAVQGTNDSSIRSKWSAAVRGYFKDEFLSEICKSGVFPSGQSSCIRTPIINRGYWIRMHAINHVIMEFLDYFSASKVTTQIISLGAGYDSTFFRLSSAGHMESCCYIEVDFPELLKKKLDVIRKSEKLLKFFPLFDHWSSAEVLSSGHVFDSPNFKLIGADLNDRKMLSDLLKCAGVDFKRPTLLLSEVVLVYLNSDSSSDLIQWAAEKFDDAIFLTYEQVYPNDAFGDFMCQHFKNIGTGLKSVNEFPTVSSQVRRYSSRGWSVTVASDMNYFFNNIVPVSEKNRIDSVEMFDEYEEWHLKCAHYVLITAFKGSSSLLRNFIWREPDHPSMFHATTAQDSVATADKIVEIESDGLLAYSSSAASDILEPCYRWTEIELRCNFSEPVHWNQIFGHTCNSLTLSGNVALFTLGGFGEKRFAGCHCRMTGGHIVSIENPIESSEINLFETMYHTCTSVSLNRAVIFGGRASPAKPTSNVYLLEFENLDDTNNRVAERLSKIETSGDGPSPRWRHTAVEYKGSIVIFGGRNSDEKFMDDCWMLNCTTWIWTKVQGTGELPAARHTHTSEVWQSEVLVICGLGQEQVPLNSVHLLNMTSLSWRKLPVVGDALFPRYSHTSTVYHDYLILIGGVSLSHSFPLATVICLTNGMTVNFDLKIPPEAFPTMLHNHDAVVCRKDGDVIVVMFVGGGGNCFSFGTHLNKFPLTLHLTRDRIASEIRSKHPDVASTSNI